MDEEKTSDYEITNGLNLKEIERRMQELEKEEQ